eukprot:1764162-Prymnesium_polylepis.3
MCLGEQPGGEQQNFVARCCRVPIASVPKLHAVWQLSRLRPPVVCRVSAGEARVQVVQRHVVAMAQREGEHLELPTARARGSVSHVDHSRPTHVEREPTAVGHVEPRLALAERRALVFPRRWAVCDLHPPV